MPDLKQELQSLANRRSAESSADFDAVLTTAGSRRRRRTAAGAAAAAAVVAVAAVVTLVPQNHGDPAPADPAPATTESPRLPVTVTPATARPGEIVALTFPESSGRGISFQLAKETDPSKILYYLTSDWGRPGYKPTWSVGMLGGPDIGINGPGPDHVVIPDIAEDGVYRLCTANAFIQVCGLVTVRR